MPELIVTFRELLSALRDLDIPPYQPVIAHTTANALGEVRGGAETVLGALLSAVDTVMLPAFTYQTMIIPEDGPADNAIQYGSGVESNRMAEFFSAGLPADLSMGPLPDILHRNPDAARSAHPILSFLGLGVDAALQKQSLAEPLAPIQKLMDIGGWVLLLGVSHTANTSIHLAEFLAGRKQFTRWALLDQKVVRCPGFPGCSAGFGAAAESLASITRKTILGTALIQAIPLQPMVEKLVNLFQSDSNALLCQVSACAYCASVRRHNATPK